MLRKLLEILRGRFGEEEAEVAAQGAADAEGRLDEDEGGVAANRDGEEAASRREEVAASREGDAGGASREGEVEASTSRQGDAAAPREGEAATRREGDAVVPLHGEAATPRQGEGGELRCLPEHRQPQNAGDNQPQGDGPGSSTFARRSEPRSTVTCTTRLRQDVEDHFLAVPAVRAESAVWLRALHEVSYRSPLQEPLSAHSLHGPGGGYRNFTEDHHNVSYRSPVQEPEELHVLLPEQTTRYQGTGEGHTAAPYVATPPPVSDVPVAGSRPPPRPRPRHHWPISPQPQGHLQEPGPSRPSTSGVAARGRDVIPARSFEQPGRKRRRSPSRGEDPPQQRRRMELVPVVSRRRRRSPSPDDDDDDEDNAPPPRRARYDSDSDDGTARSEAGSASSEHLSSCPSSSGGSWFPGD